MSNHDPAQESHELRRILSTRLRIDNLRPLSALVRVEFGATRLLEDVTLWRFAPTPT